MMLASQSLEQAIFACLAADSDLIGQLGGKWLYDEPRRDAAFPYLTLHVAFSRDWSTSSDRGEEHRLMINVWTGSADRQLQQGIQSRLRAILLDPVLELTGHRLVNLTVERCEIRANRKNRLLQGVVQLRAVTEETSV